MSWSYSFLEPSFTISIDRTAFRINAPVTAKIDVVGPRIS